MKYKTLFLSIIFFCLTSLIQASDSQPTRHILFIQSYDNFMQGREENLEGLLKGFSDQNVSVDIETEYLDADYWVYEEEKVIMQRICRRAKEKGTDMIVVANDEAFHTLFSCGDSLAYKVPVVFFGIKYPDVKLMSSLKNICGYTSKPDFRSMLQQAHLIFPNKSKFILVSDNSFLSKKGYDAFIQSWNQFALLHPNLKLVSFNIQHKSMVNVLSVACMERTASDKLVFVPKWSSFMTLIGKNSKVPVFSCQYQSFRKGAFCVDDVLPFNIAYKAAVLASKILKGASPNDFPVVNETSILQFDYKQLNFFRIPTDKISSGKIIGQPFWDKYCYYFYIGYGIILFLLIYIIVKLVRANKRGAIRRVHMQSKLLMQEKLISQRNDFDNILHSIRTGVVTYDTHFRLRFVNHSMLEMLHLPLSTDNKNYEGMLTGSLLRVYTNGKQVLPEMLEEVIKTGHSLPVKPNSFLQSVENGVYFPVSGELRPIVSDEKIVGAVFSAQNVAAETIQKRFFDLAVEESHVFSWQYNSSNQLFTFSSGFLQQLGLSVKVNSIFRRDLDEYIHPDERISINNLFNELLISSDNHKRMILRLRKSEGYYEWWEFRISVFGGLNVDVPYSILGVCQSIQQYKEKEVELAAARDKAMQADRLKSAFLANMSHEIRTPLNSIVGFSDLLTNASDFEPGEVKQFIKIINKNCSMLLALINDILDVSRIESGAMEFQMGKHNLPLILKGVYDSQRLNMPKNVELVLLLPPKEKKYIITDSVRLQQVVNNLINNSAKFTQQGAITFGFRSDEPGYTIIFVEDTGKGMNAEALEHIFERFYKIDSFTQGAGLGLSICRTIVERLNGTISVQSEEGKGTRFEVRLPDGISEV